MLSSLRIDARAKKVGRVNQEVSREKIMEAESRLAELGYWTGATDGKVDQAFRHAIFAFQKLTGRKRTGYLSAEDLQALRTASRPVARETGYAHVEIDITHQVLFFVAPDGTISKILPVCTGNQRG